MYFSIFIPLYVSLKFYGKIKSFYFYLLVFLSLLFRSLIGFEYYSTIAISVLIPVFIQLINQRKGIKSYFIEVFRAFVLTIFAFFLSFSILTLGSGSDSIIKVAKSYFIGVPNSQITEDAASRSTFFEVNNDMYKDFTIKWNLQRNLDSEPINQDSGYNGRVSLLNYIDFTIFLRLNDYKEILLQLFYTIQFIGIMLAFIFIVLHSLLIRTIKSHMYLIIVITSFLASFSWPFLMPLHFYWHSIVWRGISDSAIIFPFYTFVIIIFFDILYYKITYKKMDTINIIILN
jgi:hypothetical protein